MVKKIPKFSLTQETIKNKKGKNIKIVSLKANSEKHLISHQEVKELFYSLVEKDKANEKIKIVGANKYREVWTIKTQYVNDIVDFDNYMRNKSMSHYINEYYQVQFIKMP